MGYYDAFWPESVWFGFLSLATKTLKTSKYLVSIQQMNEWANAILQVFTEHL